MCGRFQKTMHYTLHATACLDQHLITISSPAVLHKHWLIHWLSVQPCSHPSPARRVSLSLSVCVCVDAAVYCTHRQRVGKRPPDVRAEHAALAPWRTPDFDPHTSHMSWLGIITASPQTFAHAIKPAFSVFWTTSIASCRSFADLLITCMHPRTYLRARK